MTGLSRYVKSVWLKFHVKTDERSVTSLLKESGIRCWVSLGSEVHQMLMEWSHRWPLCPKAHLLNLGTRLHIATCSDLSGTGRSFYILCLWLTTQLRQYVTCYHELKPGPSSFTSLDSEKQRWLTFWKAKVAEGRSVLITQLDFFLEGEPYRASIADLLPEMQIFWLQYFTGLEHVCRLVNESEHKEPDLYTCSKALSLKRLKSLD